MLFPMSASSPICLLLTAFGLAAAACAGPPGLHAAPLPAPTGPHRVGTTILHVTDSTRLDPIADAPGQYRDLTVQVWYPTSASGKRALYLPDPGLADAMREAEYWEQDDATIAGWRALRTHAILDAPLDADGSLRPLLLFSHGLGVARAHYTTLVQDLASHGYVVGVVDHPYGGFAVSRHGRTLTPAQDAADLDDPAVIASRTGLWSADVTAVIDRLLDQDHEGGRFADAVDTTRIAMLGHSLGGTAALEACLADARIRACVDMDGAPFGRVEQEGFRRPTLVLGSGPDYSDEDLAARGRTREEWDRMGAQIRSIWESIASVRPDTPAYFVSIRGTGHMSFSDAPFVMPTTLTRFGGRIIEPKRGFEITMATLRAFLDVHLQGQDGEPFETLQARYPEVSLQRLQP